MNPHTCQSYLSNEARMLTIQDCETIVRKYLKTDNFAITRLQDEDCLVKINVNHDSKEKTLNFFKKLPTQVSKIQQILFDDFKKTVPKFDPTFTAKPYFWKSEFVLFEDLTSQGFQAQQGIFSLEEIKAVLKALAKFHAASFAFEEIKSKELGKKYRLDGEYKLVSSNIDLQESDVQSIVSSITEDDDAVKITEDLEARQLSQKYRKTLGHSNLVPKNIMFKHENEEPAECKLINFKYNHYAPPIYDVLQLIFLNTSKDFRQYHLETLISDYYNFLKKELENYCLKIEEIFTVDELQLAAHSLLPLIKLEVIVHHGQRDFLLEEFKEVIKYPILSREDCYIIAKNNIRTSDYNFLSFMITPLDEVNGFLGGYYKLKIKIIHENEEKTINNFVKLMPKGEVLKKMIEENCGFLKEKLIYQIVASQMHQLGIYTFDDCSPICYFQRHQDLMVFEDVALKNYKVLPPQIQFDFDLLCLVLKKVAKFHASMLMFEEKMSELNGKKWRFNEEYGDYVKEAYFLQHETHLGAKMMEAAVRSIIDVANLFPELQTAEDQKNFDTVWPKLQERFYTAIQASDRFRNVLAHGDLWSSNIMIQMNGDKPADCRFVDYQCSRYCPPAHDYLEVLYLNTNRDTRMKYEAKLEEIYYNELSQILSACNYEIEKIIPRQEFVESIKYIRPQVVMQTFNWNTFSQLTPEQKSSFITTDAIANKVFFEDRKEFLATMSEVSSSYKNKLKECVIDLYDICKIMCSEL